MKSISKLACLLITLTMLVSITACGTSSTPATTGNEESKSSVQPAESTPEAAPVEEPEEKVTLKIFAQQMKENIEKDSRTKAFYDSIDQYTAANPNVTITVDALATEPYNDRAKTLAAANELPDMFEVLGSWNSGFVRSELLMDLTDVINSDPEWKGIIRPTAVNNFTVDGKVYGICLEEGGSTTLLFYNAAILEECGFNEPPKTMTDLKNYAKVLNEKGYTPISLGNKGDWVAESCYLSAIGSRYTGNDWNWDIVNRTGAKFTDPEFVKGLSLMQELANEGIFNKDLNSIDYQQARVPYFNEKAAMFIEGHWAINSLLADCPEDVLATTHVTGIPEIEDAKVPGYAAGGNGGWAYSLNSKLEGAQKDAAIGWLKTLISQESAKTVLEGGNPCAIEPGSYDQSKMAPLQVEFFDLMKTVEFCETYDLIFEPNVIEVMCSGIQDLLINNVTPEKLAEKIQAEYEKVTE
ncbi:MAG: extracellular solute-binding protein [Clostridia bacterium]|nr:extracellular solute-binding protein [Clostridia bacterium]